ncbi:hypothetical protein EU522_00210 [Candidatus Thorarchaeota archaeon]|nr:MAG: hypothetical protein EU522_00210 [Candidatus Thorarchaeota archaeon]
MRITENQKIALVIMAVLLLLSQTPQSSYSPVNVSIDNQYAVATEGYGHVSEIDYQWQEINGFCHWASSTMILRSAGVDLDLHDLFVVSGIGFSAVYVRYEDTMALLPGAIWRQIIPLSFVSDFYGLNYSIYVDTSSPSAALFVPVMGIDSLNYTDFDGPSEALNLMRTSIDEGYPPLIWVDPYYLPAKDYDINRELGITSDMSGSGHAVVIVGYNDTSETAWIADPGVGAFGEYFGYPFDGRWYYEISYANLSLAWKALTYLTILIRPETNSIPDKDLGMMNLICSRLEGDRTSYAPSQEDVFFLSFGANSFRAMSLDLNPQGLSLLLNDVGSHIGRVLTLWNLGFITEFTCSLQYLSFRAALQQLPTLFPAFDLTSAISKGMEALPHLAALSNNATLASTDPNEFGGSLLWDTLVGLSEDYDVQSDLEAAIVPYQENITAIAEHLEAIADAWDSLAVELRQVLSGNPLESMVILAAGSASLFVIVVLVFTRRRR